ncbi:MAG: hypothetical protein ACOY0T_28405 [Myxococcota bacterium]
MSVITNIIGMLLGVSTVLLACSLVVMCFVRIVQYLANSRGKTLGEMLGALNRGFRTAGGDLGTPGDPEQVAFVNDVLTYPTLHDTKALQALAGANPPWDKLEEVRSNVAAQVEYLAKADLLNIVETMLEPAHCNSAYKPDDWLLPSRWSSTMPPEARRYAAFREFVDTWYATLEGSASEQFKLQSRRLTASVTCLLVVFLNLDGLQLAVDLFGSPETQTWLGDVAPALVRRADEMGASLRILPYDRDELLKGASGVVAQANGIWAEPALHFGWQNSEVVRSWCTCQQRTDPAASCDGVIVATARWFVGLVFSCLLLCLGAPFWADMLKRLLGFRNAVETSVLGATSASEDAKPALPKRSDP